MRNFSFARSMAFGILIAGSLGFQPLDNCKMCHQTAPTSAEHVPVAGISWPVCATCHGLDPDTGEASTVIVGMHANHVQKLSFDCSMCHSFSNSDDETAARARLSQMLEKGATK